MDPAGVRSRPTTRGSKQARGLVSAILCQFLDVSLCAIEYYDDFTFIERCTHSIDIPRRHANPKQLRSPATARSEGAHIHLGRAIGN